MLIRRVSMISGVVREKEINVTEAELRAWQGGLHIQHAMPNVSPSDREFILSGITDEEWDTCFGEER